ncbi:MAG: LysM domain-containing protein [bacterium]|nr:LysM domain-containing protein [bacterium]
MERIRFLLLVVGLSLGSASASAARAVRNPDQCDPVVTVTTGDSFSGVMRRAFGKNAAWPAFMRFNRHIVDPHLIVPGDEICVPKGEVLFGTKLPPAIERIVEIRVAAQLAARPASADATQKSDQTELEQKQKISALWNRIGELERKSSEARNEAAGLKEVVKGLRADAALKAEADRAETPDAEEFPISFYFVIILGVCALVLAAVLVGSRRSVRRLKRELEGSNELAGLRVRELGVAAHRAEQDAADIAAAHRSNADFSRQLRERTAEVERLSGTEAGREIMRLDNQVATLTARAEEAEEARATAEERATRAEERKPDIQAALALHFGNGSDVAEVLGHIVSAMKANEQIAAAFRWAAEHPDELLDRISSNSRHESRASQCRRLLQLVRDRQGVISSDGRAVEVGRLGEWMAQIDVPFLTDEEIRTAFRTIGENAETRFRDIVPHNGDAADQHNRGEIKFLEEALFLLGRGPAPVTRILTPVTPIPAVEVVVEADSPP